MEERYSIQEFVGATKQSDRKQGFFELETPRMLEVNLDGLVWSKAGAMVAYNGQIKFEREGVLEHGVGKFLKKAFTGEGSSLMKASGSGQLYLADQGKKITILSLNDESITVNGNDLLAFEPTIEWDIKLMRKVAGMLSGGLFNIHLSGKGLIAITSHYEPLTLFAEKGRPVYTDPNATVAWSGSLSPEFVTDVSLKTFLGRGSGESIQMKFDGDGFVVVQPFEEIYLSQQS
ncbi:AIM24 family protein [Bacillus sp. FJAT-42376]|uniref:AIM24 family protein n=1 Tax=Bacillus sp. FJAT-42376 TaxID=2014076 RepID=UPI000F501F04|nr:AIM24 family protein [Bacillus sp. FJAT-42376]AZB43266.1 AIM24 family protein [Bacillus sp. FJAT-42376]